MAGYQPFTPYQMGQLGPQSFAPGFQPPSPTNYTPMMQNAVQGQQTGQNGYVCRAVTSREEAMAIPTEFFGLGTVMPDLSHGMIYLKRFNPNTGASDFLEFVYAPPAPPKQELPAGEFVTVEMFNKLREEVEALRGGAANVSHE